MAKRRSPREVGSIRKLASGRFQARVLTESGERQSLGVFRTKTEASAAIAAYSAPGADKIDPVKARSLFGDYAVEWLTLRQDLAPLTLVAYDSLLRNYILPHFGNVQFGQLTPMGIRHWYNRLPENTRRPQAYGLLNTICNAAIADEYLGRNPCKVVGGSLQRHPERQIVGVSEIYGIAASIAPRLRALVLLGGFANGRIGEMRGLVRSDWDSETKRLRIERQAIYLGGTVLITPPKSKAGVRRIMLPDQVAEEMDGHLAEFVGPDESAPVFTAERGGFLHDATFRKEWHDALATARANGYEIPEGFRFHDLRHTGNTLTARIPGITIADLQARLGDATPAMALHYMHADEGSSRRASDGLNQTITAFQDQRDRGDATP